MTEYAKYSGKSLTTSLCAFKYCLHNAIRIVCYTFLSFLCFFHSSASSKEIVTVSSIMLFFLISDFTYFAFKTKRLELTTTELTVSLISIANTT